MAQVGADLHALNTELKAAGAWVFTGGLHDPAASTVVRRRERDFVITDGPYVEGKEHIGGFWIIDVPDLDVALAWAQKATGQRLCRSRCVLSRTSRTTDRAGGAR